jgi:hypothetical protein
MAVISANTAGILKKNMAISSSLNNTFGSVTGG